MGVMGGAAATTLLASPALARTSASSWALHEGKFTDADFDGFKEAADGLLYKVVAEGSGDKPAAGQMIAAHYSGYLLNGSQFDSSYRRGSPLSFKVGTGRVIKGWDAALLDMRVGEKRILRIPSPLAYGERGAGGVIPARATLVFYVELVSVA